MTKMVNGWVHEPGKHCGSVAVHDVMRFYGHPLSEALCFGLGSGLGFFYTVSEGMSPTRMIFLRGPGLEHNFFSLLGGPDHWITEDDADEALDKLKATIGRDVPVVMQTDIFYLDYYGSSTHFPGHVVVAWGYDDEAGEVLVSDTGFEELQHVPYESMKLARTSQALPFPLSNNWFPAELAGPLPPLEELIPVAIRRNARMMLEGATSGRGTSGVAEIAKWAEDMPAWAGVEDWSWCARFGYQVIVLRGVDGAGFRRLYTDFLAEGEELVPGMRGLGLSARMAAIARKWEGTAAHLKDLSEMDTPRDSQLRLVQRDALELWEMEGDFFTLALDKGQAGP